jgi:hypothetical protein
LFPNRKDAEAVASSSKANTDTMRDSYIAELGFIPMDAKKKEA